MPFTSTELANFRPDEPDALVAASLACPACLHGDVAWRLSGELEDARAVCHCHGCGWGWSVFLTPSQALRLSLHECRPLDARLPAAASPLL